MPSALVEYLIGELKSINFHLYGSKIQKTYLYILYTVSKATFVWKRRSSVDDSHNASLHEALCPVVTCRVCSLQNRKSGARWVHWLSAWSRSTEWISVKSEVSTILWSRAGENMLLWVLGAALLARSAGFYLPGLAPVSFCVPGNDQVPDCKVNATWYRWPGAPTGTVIRQLKAKESQV